MALQKGTHWRARYVFQSAMGKNDFNRSSLQFNWLHSSENSCAFMHWMSSYLDFSPDGTFLSDVKAQTTTGLRYNIIFIGIISRAEVHISGLLICQTPCFLTMGSEIAFGKSYPAQLQSVTQRVWCLSRFQQQRPSWTWLWPSLPSQSTRFLSFS